MVNRYPQPDISVLQPRHSAPWPDSLLEISGEMSVRVREFDWSKTPLGPIESLPPSLRLITKTVLANKFPMCIHWGRNFIPIYNDWFIPCIGCKHPSMLGQSVREAMYEIWESIIQPIFTQVYQAGKTILNEKQLSPIRRVDRSGYLEEVYATLGYSPIYDDQEVIAGVLVTMTDTTVKILSERRLKTLRDLAEPDYECQRFVRSMPKCSGSNGTSCERYPFCTDLSIGQRSADGPSCCSGRN